ncbi:hypothetical protein J6590_030995 [Homalodisca vitripennis]|nr:hypothetical protein J6590_030995 [Homalodisca vitripennis]
MSKQKKTNGGDHLITAETTAMNIIWLIVTVVDEESTNELTDQLMHLNALGAPPQRDPSLTNPFSPTHLNFQRYEERSKITAPFNPYLSSLPKTYRYFYNWWFPAHSTIAASEAWGGVGSNVQYSLESRLCDLSLPFTFECSAITINHAVSDKITVAAAQLTVIFPLSSRQSSTIEMKFRVINDKNIDTLNSYFQHENWVDVIETPDCNMGFK